MYEEFEIELLDTEDWDLELLNFGEEIINHEEEFKEEEKILANTEEIIGKAYVLKLPKANMDIVMTADPAILSRYQISNPDSYYILPELVTIPYLTVQKYASKGMIVEETNINLNNSINTAGREALVNYISLKVEE